MSNLPGYSQEKKKIFNNYRNNNLIYLIVDMFITVPHALSQEHCTAFSLSIFPFTKVLNVL